MISVGVCFENEMLCSPRSGEILHRVLLNHYQKKKFSSHCPLKLLYKLIIGKKSFSFIELDQLLLIPVVQLQRLLHTVLQLGCRLVLSFWRSLIIILLHFLQAKIKFHKITSLPYPKKWWQMISVKKWIYLKLYKHYTSNMKKVKKGINVVYLLY